ncbi:hypothetical protein XCR1_4110001 [Xenorhabdus cabanillasii JM26]|uniref:Uncharacterized protein n=1 Tax=Xenorhabdus cabanillasii JM26 TaxID=1427517 RepID=W1J9D8_9GAMM|nr:hypothetical protein XCR1_4110001 [Xenorhabdus cabanillasii JM26]
MKTLARAKIVPIEGQLSFNATLPKALKEMKFNYSPEICISAEKASHC